jgi:hypothetical protein
MTRSTLVLRTDNSGHTMWVDIGWQACDERLVSVAEAKALGGGGRGRSPRPADHEVNEHFRRAVEAFVVKSRRRA